MGLEHFLPASDWPYNGNDRADYYNRGLSRAAIDTEGMADHSKQCGALYAIESLKRLTQCRLAASLMLLDFADRDSLFLDVIDQ